MNEGGEEASQASGRPPFHSRRFRIALLVAAGVLLLVLGGWLREVTTPIVVALVIAYVLDPVVVLLERAGVRRWAGVALVYALFLVVIGLVLVAVIPPVYGQVSKLPGYVEQVAERLGLARLVREEEPPEAEPPALGAEPEVEEMPEGAPPTGDILETIKTAARQNMGKIAVRALAVFRSGVQRATASIGRILSALTQVALVFIYTFFFLLGLHPFYEKVRGHLPGRYREEIVRVVGRLDRSYAAFFRGRIIVCLCSGVLTSVGLWICGIPFWLLIGMTVGVLGIIPFIGVLIGLIPAVLLALLTGGWQTTLGVLVVFAAVQAIEPVLTPLILSRGLQLHPVTILIGLLVGGRVFGLFGAVIAVPLASTAKILGEEFLLPPLRELAEEQPVGDHHGDAKDTEND